MYKNIIFDVGKVLVSFDWEEYLCEMGLSGEEYEAVADATIRSNMWPEYDRSKLADEEIRTSLIAQAPKHERYIQKVWDDIHDRIKCYPYTKEWIADLKSRGYKVYFLSNYPRRTYHLTKEELSFEHDMDGGIFSYQVQYIKPERDIYKALMDQYHLNPKECVFVDDNEDNIQAAKELGMKGILFHSIEQAKEELNQII